MHLPLPFRSIHRRLLAGLLVLVLVFQTACGTLLYPDRRGQTDGRIDPAVAIMNGIGLLFFVIPGLVAFAIDFSTGAIYLPPEEGNAGADNDDEARVIYLDPDQITPETVSAAIHDHTGVELTLTEEDLRVLRDGDAEDVSARLAALKRGDG